MPLTTVLLCAAGAGLVVSILYALRNGYDVKAGLKIPFIAFTFEAKEKNKSLRKRIE